MKRVETIILGAGPAGLGAAWRLKEKDYTNFILLEKESYAGGLSASFVTPEGFIFDLGGHVCFSQDPYYLDMARRVLKEDILFHSRDAWVYLDEKTVRYPFQDHISALPSEVQYRIALDFLKQSRTGNSGERVPGKRSLHVLPANQRGNRSAYDLHFLKWIHQSFGKTIADLFMIPYNRKVWACDLRKMGVYWIKDRVSTLALPDILKRIIFSEKSQQWGPNASFFFPRYGTGQLYTVIAGHLKEFISYQSHVRRISLRDKVIYLENGQVYQYSHLISSLPLNEFVKMVEGVPAGVQRAGLGLRYNSGQIVGLGLHFPLDTPKHWIYFPEKEFPWFRMTVISNYSPAMVPEGKSSLMFDISYHPNRPRLVAVDDIIGLLRKVRFLPLITERDIASVFEKRVRYFYPLPMLDRDEHLSVIGKYLSFHSVDSVGRFGKWRYEEGNMDHAFLHGKDAADKMIKG